MKFGVTIFPTAESIAVRDLARACEDLGLESLFFPEHTHIPVDGTSRHGPDGNAELAPEFLRLFDPFVALTAAACATTELRVGTGLCLAAQRDPIILAKEVSTLDVISEGRVVLGVGPGWHREQMANHGLDPTRRHRVLEEHIETIRAIWTRQEAEFHGEIVDLDPLWQWPKPVQHPHPPILIGGDGPKVLRRVVEHGDGWLATAKREDVAKLGDRLDELADLAAAHGRGPIPVSLQRPPLDVAVVQRLAELGVDRCIFGLSSSTADVVLPELRAVAALQAALA